MAHTRPFRGIALLVALAAVACGSAGAAPPPPPTLPSGYVLYDGGQLGFRFGLAPGWQRSAAPAPDGANFADPSNRGALLVHVGHARSTDLDAATGAVMFDLTGGNGAAGGSMSATTLAGRPARRVGGAFDAAGATQQIEAVVTLDGGLAWVLALAGPADRVAADDRDFDRMRTSFQLVGTRPSLPAQVAAGERAPGFPELDRIKGPVVLNFFASWCDPCRQEMPLLAQRARASGGRFTVLGMDTQDDASRVPAFLKQLGVSFPTGYDRDGHLSQEYLLPGVPGTFFLDSRHVVRNLVYGPLSADTLQQGLKAA
ncbi:MAG TPA: TlpA disulfide reductase family protein, partial [Candidatus Dormibacteraeota bacterium]